MPVGPWIGPLISGLAGLSGLFGKKSHNEVDKTTTSTPTYDATNQGFRDFLIKSFQGMVDSSGQGSDFENAYRTGGLNNIRIQYMNANKGIDDIISSRGLGRTTGGASALASTAVNSSNSIANFLNNLPLVMDQRRQQILNSAGGYQSSLPVGNTTHVKGFDDTSQGGGVGGAVQGGASGLAGFLGQLSAQQSLQKILGGGSSSGGSSGGNGGWDSSGANDW